MVEGEYNVKINYIKYYRKEITERKSTKIYKFQNKK